jgi:hypothetical protein
MKRLAFLVATFVSLPVAAQTTFCSTYGNNISCQTMPAHQAVSPNGCGSAVTCALNGYMKARQQQQNQQIQQEELEKLRLQNEQLRLQNQSIYNQMGASKLPPVTERPSEVEIKAAYCLGALSNSGHALEIRMLRDYLSAHTFSAVGQSILGASQNQGKVDRDFIMRREADFITKCSEKSTKSIDDCSVEYDERHSSDETNHQIISCKGVGFLSN